MARRRVTFRDLRAWRDLNDGTGRRVPDVPAPVPCPECGAPLEVGAAEVFTPATGARHSGQVATCTGCSFAHVVDFPSIR